MAEARGRESGERVRSLACSATCPHHGIDMTDGKKKRSGPEAMGGVLGAIWLHHGMLLLEFRAIVDLLVQRGVFTEAEVLGHLESYRRDHEAEFREELLQLLERAMDAPPSEGPNGKEPS